MNFETNFFEECVEHMATLLLKKNQHRLKATQRRCYSKKKRTSVFQLEESYIQLEKILF